MRLEHTSAFLKALRNIPILLPQNAFCVAQGDGLASMDVHMELAFLVPITSEYNYMDELLSGLYILTSLLNCFL